MEPHPTHDFKLVTTQTQKVEETGEINLKHVSHSVQYFNPSSIVRVVRYSTIFFWILSL